MGMFWGEQNPRKALFKWEGDLACFGSFFWYCKENEKQLAYIMLLSIEMPKAGLGSSAFSDLYIVALGSEREST